MATLNTLSYEGSATVTFSPEDVATLLKCSAAHYDSACKAEGRPGGIIYAMNNFPSRTLTFREIDRLSKVLEQGSLLGLPHSSTLCGKLHSVLYQLTLNHPEPIEYGDGYE